MGILDLSSVSQLKVEHTGSWEMGMRWLDIQLMGTN